MEDDIDVMSEMGGEIDTLKAENKRLEKIIDKANKASRLYIGSEYFNDPAYVIKCAEISIGGYVESLKAQIRRAKKAEAKNKTLQDNLKALIYEFKYRLPMQFMKKALRLTTPHPSTGE